MFISLRSGEKDAPYMLGLGLFVATASRNDCLVTLDPLSEKFATRGQSGERRDTMAGWRCHVAHSLCLLPKFLQPVGVITFKLFRFSNCFARLHARRSSRDYETLSIFNKWMCAFIHCSTSDSCATLVGLTRFVQYTQDPL